MYGTVVKESLPSCLNSSADMWLVLPGTLMAALKTPGFRRARSIISRTLLAGTLGCTESTSGVVLTQVTGVSCFSGLNLRILA